MPRADGHMPTLDEWTAQVCTELGIDPTLVDRDRVLDLARDVAHGVARPAAPLTAYLMGLAVGRGLSPTEAATAIAALIPPSETPGESRSGSPAES